MEPDRDAVMIGKTTVLRLTFINGDRRKTLNGVGGEGRVARPHFVSPSPDMDNTPFPQYNTLRIRVCWITTARPITASAAGALTNYPADEYAKRGVIGFAARAPVRVRCAA